MNITKVWQQTVCSLIQVTQQDIDWHVNSMAGTVRWGVATPTEFTLLHKNVAQVVAEHRPLALELFMQICFSSYFIIISRKTICIFCENMLFSFK